MKKYYFLIMIVLGFCSFKKEKSDTVAGPAEVDVYVAGAQSNGYHNVAKYWKNGQAISLTDATESAGAYSIFLAPK